MSAAKRIHRGPNGATLSVIATSMLVSAMLTGIYGCGEASTVQSSQGVSAEIVAGTGDRMVAHVVQPLLESSDFLDGHEQYVDYSQDEVVRIVLADDATSISQHGANVENNTVTITEGGTYLISGTLTDGQIVIDTSDALQLVLSDASISCSDKAALYVANAKQLTITLASETENKLAVTDTFTNANTDINAVVFSHDSILINGDGMLVIRANEGSGIVSNDELIIAGGALNVACADNALQANDWIALVGGTATLACDKDALHVDSNKTDLGFVYLGDGTLNIDQANDGIHASGVIQMDGGRVTARVIDDAFHSDSDLQIAGGSISVLGSHEGLEAASVTIKDGEVSLVATDDGINATGRTGAANADANIADETAVLTIAGGTLAIDSEGDGIDTNGALLITGGTTAISAGTATSDATAIDYVSSAIIDGGAIIACGRSEGALPFNERSAQASALVQLSGMTEGTVTLNDAAGNLLASLEPTKPYESVIVSSPDLVSKTHYILNCGRLTCNLSF